MRRSDFSGGVSERPPSTLRETVVADSLNLHWNGVLRPLPSWEPVATLPHPVVGGITLPSGKLLVFCYDVAAGRHRAYVIPPAGLVAEIADADLGARKRLRATYTHQGVVLTAPGIWPRLVRDDEAGGWEIVGLQDMDRRVRSAFDFRVGPTADQGELFRVGAHDNYRGRLKNEVPYAAVGPALYVAVAAELTFNRVVLKVGAAGSFDVSVNWIRDDGELLGTAPHEGEPPAVIVRLDANAANGNTLTFTVPWDDLYATISERPYAGVVGATIGRGQIRALVTMTKVGGDPGFELRSVSLEHTEYLRQIMGVEPPRLAISHRDRLWLAGGIFTQLSPVNRLEGWRAGDQEYYRAGGDRIEAMLSHERELLVFKRNAIFAVTGNSYHDWGKDKVLDNTGTSAVDGVLSVQGVVVYEDVSGRLAMLLQGEPRYITRHLADELGRNRGAGGPRGAAPGGRRELHSAARGRHRRGSARVLDRSGNARPQRRRVGVARGDLAVRHAGAGGRFVGRAGRRPLTSRSARSCITGTGRCCVPTGACGCPPTSRCFSHRRRGAPYGGSPSKPTWIRFSP